MVAPMLTFRVLSALLSYPTPELKAGVGEGERILHTEGLLADEPLRKVGAFIQTLQAMPQLEAESWYIEAFDRGRSTSLYLFEHIHGESRDRGEAMVRLLMRYRMHGLDLSAKELPDFLPLFLEFLSTCRFDEARKYLSEVIDIIAMIGERLRKRGAMHTCVLEAIVSLLPVNGAEKAVVTESRDDDRDDTPAALDAAWEEAPVTFDDASLSAAQSQMDADRSLRARKSS
jgi:nitrate reductase molybdenum cofactor assembly chaperone NarJ/NarW